MSKGTTSRRENGNSQLSHNQKQTAGDIKLDKRKWAQKLKCQNYSTSSPMVNAVSTLRVLQNRYLWQNQSGSVWSKTGKPEKTNRNLIIQTV
jgi:hypothetical protein